MSETKTGNPRVARFSYVDFAAPSGRVADQFRLREVLRERDAPPEEPDLGGDCTRGLGERLNDGAGVRYVGADLGIDEDGGREIDREKDRPDGLVKVGEFSGLDRLELHTDGLDALRLRPVVKDLPDPGAVREKLRFRAVERNDCRFRPPSASLLETVGRLGPPRTIPSREFAAVREAILEARTPLLEYTEFRFHTRDRRRSLGRPRLKPPTMDSEVATRVRAGPLPRSFR